MSSSLSDRARIRTKGLFGPKKTKPRLRQEVRTRLTLEVLEDRNLLSATGGGEPMVPTMEVQAGNDAVQQAMNYVARYESAVAAIEQTAANLEQQVLLEYSHLESLIMDQLFGQGPFSNSNASGANGQSSSAVPGQPGGQQSISQPVSSDQPVATPGALLASADGLSPDGGSDPPDGFSPQQISQAYGFNQITFDNGTITGNGSGQTIAIVDAYNQPNIASDLSAFDSEYGLAAPPSFNVVNQTGGTTLPGSNTDWGMEESLDVEWAHAMAPGANILLVEANSASYSDLMTAVSYASNQPGVSVVSMSWGGGEYSSESDYDSYFTTPSGHNGVTFVAATGDYGSAGGTEYPSVSPNVLAVGGTQLTTDSEGDYESETGWSGSTGGLSTYESQPSYQNGVVTQSSTARAVPDVAYNASAASPYAVYDSSGYGGWIEVYGTSAGAPQWSALIAIADQGRALNGEGTLDGPSQTLPAIYQMPSSNFNDITTGSNGEYSAGTGYDLVTGIGTPIANLVVNSLVSYDASSWQAVNLSSDYNQTGISDGTAFSGGGLDGNGYELGTPGAIGWQGAVIPYGPANAADVVEAEGQAVDLPSGNYSDLTIFATAVNGNQTDQSFTVEYTNGATQTFTLSLSNWTTVPGQYSDEIRANVLSQYNADGDNTGTTVYDSAYALPLNPTLTIKSITLPDNSDIKVLAMGLYYDGNYYGDAGQAVNLSSAYNVTGISDGTAFSGTGLGGTGYELGTPGSIGWQGYLIPYGPANAADVVNAQGQSVSISTSLIYSTLTIFATAVNGNQTNQSFTVEYSNGYEQTFTLSLSNWTTVPGQYSDEIRADVLSQYNASGTNTGTTVYDSGYALPLNTTLTVKSITLPNDSDIDVLGMLLT